jgi:hypothetical protein
MRELFLAFLIAATLGFFSVASGGEGPAALNPDLCSAVQKANRHQYVCTRPPTLFQDGLSYWLEADVSLDRVSITHKELEKLYIEIYTDLLDTLNSQKSIRPYLASFPVTPETFFLTLSVKHTSGKEESKCLSRASLRQGMLEFDIETAFGRDVQRKALHEVVELSDLSFPSIPRSSRFLHVKLPFITQLPRTEEKEKKVFFEAVQRLCRKHALNIITLGSVGKDRGSEKPYQAAFFGSSQLKLEKARAVASSCIQEFLRLAKKEMPFCEYQRKKVQEKGCEHLLRDIAFRISFWTDNIDRPLAPAIAEIRFFEGDCEYFTADENQQLVLVFRENKEQLFKMLAEVS